eukprot:gene12707-14012_t
MNGEENQGKGSSCPPKHMDNDGAVSDEELAQLEAIRQANSASIAAAIAPNSSNPTSTESSTSRPTDQSTAREERLARKLKTIDSVTSPKSSFDVTDDDGNVTNANVDSRRVVTTVRQQSSTHMLTHHQHQHHSAPSFASGSSSAFNPTLSRPTVRMATSVSRIVASLPDRVTLVVDGTRFITDPHVFMKMPDTMLGRMFSSHSDYMRANDKGEYEVAKGISSSVFKIIMEFYKKGTMTCTPNVTIPELREACDYLLIPFNASVIRCQNLCDLLHEISNEGARKQFMNEFLEELILPVMIQCAMKGNRECHLVVLQDDDSVEWDRDYPPNMGEEFVEVLHSTALQRFFKYFENRDVAKEVLKDRGLKKVKLGIEGYPTHMEKLKFKPNGGKPEVIYNYIQRPFVHMSWEKEESKSRHVDFQCVKPKHSTGHRASVDDTAVYDVTLDNVIHPPPPLQHSYASSLNAPRGHDLTPDQVIVINNDPNNDGIKTKILMLARSKQL